MNGTTFRMPARRLATVATATALAVGPAALAGSGTAHATPDPAASDQGRASAVVLRTGLDVALLDKTVEVPLEVSLNEVRAPRSSEKTALTATLDGVDGGKPFSVLRADVAEAEATVTEGRAEASTRLARARLHVPGLPLLSVIEVDAITAKAVCETGKTPVASVALPGAVTVLGKRTTLTADGPSTVAVPGVGEVRLDWSKRETTSRTAAATALELSLTVNPLNLNVAEVEGTLTLAKATCETPPSPADAGDVQPQGAPADVVEAKGAPTEAGLAETGGGSLTPYVAGGALALLAAGGGAVALARRGRN